tara:strand:+ start:600 stop:2054 length:1455 start_codon:yes stop_codon:yes gene_type:complete
MAFTTFHRAILEVRKKDGEVWQTDSGWAGKRGGKTQYGLRDKDTAQAYVAGKDVKPDEKSVGDFKVSSTGPSEKEMVRMKKQYDGKKRQKIQDQIGRIKDPKVKESAQSVSDSMDSYLKADDDEKENILRKLVDDKLISVNTTNPDAGKKKVYFDAVLTGLDRKALGDGDALSKDMHRIMQERGIDPPQRLASADRALADMSGKHNESGMVFLLTPKDSPNYEENRKIHEANEKSYSGLGGNAEESNKRNEAMVAEVNKSLPKGSKITNAKNTGGIGKEALLKMGIDPKVDPTDLVIYYEKDGKQEMMKISAKAYSDPSSITMKNSGARKAGSEYLGKPEFDNTLQSITTNPKYNYQEDGISDEERSARKLAMKREYMTAMEKEMTDMVKPGSDGEKQLVKMWQDIHGCGHGTWTSISNKKTGESTLYPPDHYCNPKTPFQLQKNGTSVTLRLDDDGDDSVEIVLKTESKSTPKLLFNHKKKKK